MTEPPRMTPRRPGPEESTRSGGRRLLAALVAFSLSGLGFALLVRAFAPAQGGSSSEGSSEGVVRLLLAKSDEPTALLTAEGRATAGLVADFGWCEDKVCETGGVASTHPVEFLPVEVWSRLVIEGSADRVYARLCEPAGGCLPAEDVEATYGLGMFRSTPGDYTLEVVASWASDGVRGEATFRFGIRLVGGAAASEVTAPRVAEVVCTGEGADVLTPAVQVQADGLHVHVTGDGVPARTVEIRPERGGLITLEFEEQAELDSMAVLLAPTGSASVRCFDASAEKADTGDAALLEIVDRDGLWRTDALSCPPGDKIVDAGGYWFFTDSNAVASGISRAVPGVLATDAVGYGGYPVLGATPRWRVVRDGQVVASMDLSTYDDRTFVMSLFACGSSGIGKAGAPTAGTLATPFHLPGSRVCDPYANACGSVFVSAARYAEMIGIPARDLTYVPEPWMACMDSQPEGCRTDPSDVTLEVLLDPIDATRFIAEAGCGATAATVCRT